MGQTIKILVLESSPTDLINIKKSVLSGYPEAMFVVTTNAQAFHTRSAWFRYDLLIVSDHVPGFSCEEAVQHVRKYSPGLPVIVFGRTGMDNPHSKNIRRVQAYLPKHKTSQLGIAVRRLLRRAYEGQVDSGGHRAEH